MGNSCGCLHCTGSFVCALQLLYYGSKYKLTAGFSGKSIRMSVMQSFCAAWPCTVMSFAELCSTGSLLTYLLTQSDVY